MTGQVLLRPALSTDLPFLSDMLFQSVYWRALAQGVAPEKTPGLAAPGVMNALDNWMERSGDFGLIAVVNGQPLGAAWYRFYTREMSIRGYLADDIPTLVIAVDPNSRRKGIGKLLLDGLLESAKCQGLSKVSLMVSKDNFALHLYQQVGFRPVVESTDSLLMVKELNS